MGAMELDGLLVTGLVNQRYLCGYTGHASHLFVAGDTRVLVTDYRYAEIAKASCKGVEVVVRDRLTTTLPQQLQALFEGAGVKRVGFESHHTSYAAYQDLLGTKVELVPCEGMVEQLRYVKDPGELGAIGHAAGIADRALARLLAEDVKPGRTEREMARALESYLFEEGAEELAFETILLSGPRSALPHGQPTDRKLETGELLLIDFGAVVDGYRSDMTRTYVLGGANAEQRAVYEAVAAAQRAGIEALAPDIDAEVPWQAAKAVLDSTPYAEHAGEGLGHGLGLDLHERPFMGFRRPDTLRAGCVVTVEPGVYIPGWGGIRLEDDLVITKAGGERLTKASQIFELL